MLSLYVSIPVNGAQMPAYVAGPDERSGPHPAVIVLQEVFGFTPEVRRVTDLLASIGYVGLAINYYYRSDPKFSEEYTEEGSVNAFMAAATVSVEDLKHDVLAAIDWLNAQPFVKPGKIATWGFGFGASAAFVTSSVRELSGAVCFYPGNVAVPMPIGGDPPLDHVSDVSIPMLIVFGEKDYYVSRFEMDRMHKALTDHNKDFRMQIYPDVGHSFFRHGRPEAIVEAQRYSDEAIAHAVADSWNLVRVFLRDVFSRSSARAVETGEIRKDRTGPIPR